MLQTYVTGFPRIGENRELKFALEAYWARKLPFNEVQTLAKSLRAKHWRVQKNCAIDFIACNDFSYYDAMLDTVVMLGATPKRFLDIEDATERYFAMARGDKTHPAMEMTKWFNTNYHYIVPELETTTRFTLDTRKIEEEYAEAKALGLSPKINLIGPITFLALSRMVDNQDVFGLFDALLDAYEELFRFLSTLDTSLYLQCDEPIFVKTLEPNYLSLLPLAYDRLGRVSSSLKIAVVTYFDHAEEAVEILAKTPIWAIGLDFVYGKENLDALAHFGDKCLIAGLIDGRNVWKNDLNASLKLLKRIGEYLPKEQIILSTSCSLLHVPYSLQNETKLSREVKEKLSFAVEKLTELETLRAHFDVGVFVKNDETKASSTSQTQRPFIPKRSAYAQRRIVQDKHLALPILPTTTIGSFPQTKEIRALRASLKKGDISPALYESELHKAIEACVRLQEELGLDVLVHGEFERNDMVEYFGELLEGFAFSENGWVQSYGSRCVKPPLLHGSVSRKAPMTLSWITYAQSLTDKPMKGMLTGPVTILNWSFVRDDIPKSDVAFEVARAISEEIDDLQRSDIGIIQVDEAAFKVRAYPFVAPKKLKDLRKLGRWKVLKYKRF